MDPLERWIGTEIEEIAGRLLEENRAILRSQDREVRYRSIQNWVFLKFGQAACDKYAAEYKAITNESDMYAWLTHRQQQISSIERKCRWSFDMRKWHGAIDGYPDVPVFKKSEQAQSHDPITHLENLVNAYIAKIEEIVS